MYLYVYACIWIRIRIRICIMYTYTYTYTYMYMYMYMYKHMYKGAATFPFVSLRSKFLRIKTREIQNWSEIKHTTVPLPLENCRRRKFQPNPTPDEPSQTSSPSLNHGAGAPVVCLHDYKTACVFWRLFSSQTLLPTTSPWPSANGRRLKCRKFRRLNSSTVWQ